eukprot:jgi/Mesvir1/11176/Mv16996-RA.2
MVGTLVRSLIGHRLVCQTAGFARHCRSISPPRSKKAARLSTKCAHGGMGGPMDLSGYLQRVKDCNSDPSLRNLLLPFVIGSEHVGYVHQRFAERLRPFGDVFVIEDGRGRKGGQPSSHPHPPAGPSQATAQPGGAELRGGLAAGTGAHDIERKDKYAGGGKDSTQRLATALKAVPIEPLPSRSPFPLESMPVPYLSLHPALVQEGLDARNAAVDRVLRTLAKEGVIGGWRDELYPVGMDFHSPPALLVERASAPFFGIKAYGVHVNGYVERADGSKLLWVARRSPDKPTWPNLLDHIAAGGQWKRVPSFAE